MLDFRAAIETRDVPGGTATSVVKAQIVAARKLCET
jgi:hypothetical protein